MWTPIEVIKITQFVEDVSTLVPTRISHPHHPTHPNNPSNPNHQSQLQLQAQSADPSARSSTAAAAVLVRPTHLPVTHVDALYAIGKHQNNSRHAIPPFILGTEFAGIVVDAPSWTPFRSGMCVLGTSDHGTFSTLLSIPVTMPSQPSPSPSPSTPSSSLHIIPPRIPLATAASIGVSGPIACAIFDPLTGIARMRRGESVLVTGASGGLGLVAIQIAIALGAGKVLGLVDGKDEQKTNAVRETLDWAVATRRRKAVEKNGEECQVKVVDYNDPNWPLIVKDFTSSPSASSKPSAAPTGGVDIVFDTVGMVLPSLRALNYNGRIILVGFANRTGGKGPIETVPMNRILLNASSVIGFRFGELARRDPDQARHRWTQFLAMLEGGDVRAVTYRPKGGHNTRGDDSGKDVKYERRSYIGLQDISRALADVLARKTWGRAIVTLDPSVQSKL